MASDKTFREFRDEAEAWIALATCEYYPDILPDACRLYEPVLVEFERLVTASHSSTFLFTSIMDTRARILVRRYVLGKGEREVADELGVGWRTVNRATWRMKLKLRGRLEEIERLRYEQPPALPD